MNARHENIGVGKEDKATEDTEKDKVTDAEATGGGDEPDENGIAKWSAAGEPSHGEGMMEPNGDGDGDSGRMDEGKSPFRADEGMVRTDEKEGAKEVDQPMEEGEQGGDAKPTEDVNHQPATPSDTSVPVAQEGNSDEVPNKNTPNKERLDATQKLWSSRPLQ